MTLCWLPQVRTSENELMVLVKGSYEKVATISLPESVPTNYRTVTEAYAAESYYVLGIGSRHLAPDADVADMSRDDLEAGLTMAGLLLFRNEMKPDSPDAIEELRTAGIRCIMCTGTNVDDISRRLPISLQVTDRAYATVSNHSHRMFLFADDVGAAGTTALPQRHKV